MSHFGKAKMIRNVFYVVSISILEFPEKLLAHFTEISLVTIKITKSQTYTYQDILRHS